MEAPKAPPINLISAVFVHVADLKRSAPWYSDLLSLPLEPIEPESPIYCPTMVGLPGMVLDDNRNTIGTEHHVRQPFAFESPDCAATLRAFRSRGVPIIFEVDHLGKTFLFTFRDPFGNAVMVMEDHGHDPAAGADPGRSAGPIRNQVGGLFLRVGDLRQAVEWYCPLLGLPVPAKLDGDRFSPEMTGAATLTLIADPEVPAHQVPQFTLLTADAAAAQRFVQERGLGLLWTAPDGRSFTVKDPDGAVVGVVQA